MPFLGGAHEHGVLHAAAPAPTFRVKLFVGESGTGPIRRVVLRDREYAQVGRDEVFLRGPGPVLELAHGPDGHLSFSPSRGIYCLIHSRP